MSFQEGRVGLLSHLPIGPNTPVLRRAVHSSHDVGFTKFFGCRWFDVGGLMAHGIYDSFRLPQTGLM
jgi:hypothetical protein